MYLTLSLQYLFPLHLLSFYRFIVRHSSFLFTLIYFLLDLFLSFFSSHLRCPLGLIFSLFFLFLFLLFFFWLSHPITSLSFSPSVVSVCSHFVFDTEVMLKHNCKCWQKLHFPANLTDQLCLNGYIGQSKVLRLLNVIYSVLTLILKNT